MIEELRRIDRLNVVEAADAMEAMGDCRFLHTDLWTDAERLSELLAEIRSRGIAVIYEPDGFSLKHVARTGNH